MTEELRVRKIKNGTVIDHITAGYALSVIRVLGITGREGNIVSVLINVPSRKLGKKDIIKVEDVELNPEHVDKIALISPKATINIIRDFNVVEKKKVKPPRVIQGIIKCSNPRCISNSKEPIQSRFILYSEDPIKLRCYYCNSMMDREGILRQL